MQEKFLKSVVENLINKQAVPIVDLLFGKKNVNEFLIAKKLNLTINQTRNILYKLSDYGLVTFIRKKDKRKGWYIYFWTLNIYESMNYLRQTLRNELEQLELQMKNRQEKRYYVCNTCSIEVSEEVALLNDFTCTECEQIYELSASPDVLTQLEKNIQRIKKEIDLVSEEIKIEEDKMEKKQTRKNKKEEEEKQKEKKRKKEERQKKKEKEKKEKEKDIEKIKEKKSKKKISKK